MSGLLLRILLTNTIKQLYDDIKKDPRHKNVILISLEKEHIEERLFPAWAMGEKNMDKNSFDFANIDEETKEVFEKAINGQKMESIKTIKMVHKLIN